MQMMFSKPVLTVGCSIFSSLSHRACNSTFAASLCFALGIAAGPAAAQANARVAASCRAGNIVTPHLTTPVSDADVRGNLRENTLNGLSDRQPLRRAVRVVIENVNPFVEQARVTQTAVVTAEDALPAFIKLAFGLVIPALNTIPSVASDNKVLLATVMAQKDTSGQAPRTVCEAIASALQGIAYEVEDFDARSLGLRSAILTEKIAADSLVKLLKPSLASVTDESATTSVAFKAACDALLVTQGPDANREKQIAAIRSNLVRFSADVRQFRSRMLQLIGPSSSCDAETIKQVMFFVKAADTFVEVAETHSNNLDAVAKVEKDRSSLENRLSAPIKNPDAFFAFALVGPFVQSTDVTLTLEKRPLGSDAAYTPVAQTKIGFGNGRIFGLGFGAAWSGIESRTYTIRSVYRTPSTVGGADTVGSVIGIDAEQRGRLVPLITLDTRLYDVFHAVLGVSYRGTGDQIALSDLEYVPGVGVSILEGKLFFGVGAVGGRQRSLLAPAQLDQPVPADKSSIPTVVRTVWKPTGIVSFRLY